MYRYMCTLSVNVINPDINIGELFITNLTLIVVYKVQGSVSLRNLHKNYKPKLPYGLARKSIKFKHKI